MRVLRVISLIHILQYCTSLNLLQNSIDALASLNVISTIFYILTYLSNLSINDPLVRSFQFVNEVIIENA